jgi:hypothetical protein
MENSIGATVELQYPAPLQTDAGDLELSEMRALDLAPV